MPGNDGATGDTSARGFLETWETEGSFSLSQSLSHTGAVKPRQSRALWNLVRTLALSVAREREHFKGTFQKPPSWGLS